MEPDVPDPRELLAAGGNLLEADKNPRHAGMRSEPCELTGGLQAGVRDAPIRHLMQNSDQGSRQGPKVGVHKPHGWLSELWSLFGSLI